MTIKVAEEREAETQAEGSVLSWVGELRRVSQAVCKTAGKAPASRQQIHYALHWSAHGERFGVVVLKGRDPENAEECWALDRVLSKPSSSMTDEDVAVFRMLWDERDYDCELRAFGLGPRFGAECLRRMAQTGRLYPASDFSPLHYVDEPRPTSLAWRIDELGRQPLGAAVLAAAAGLGAAAGDAARGVGRLVLDPGDDLLDRAAGHELDEDEVDEEDPEERRDDEEQAAEDVT